MALNATPGDVTSRFALDANALASLKEQAKSDPRQALKAAAGQFEALFMNMLLKSMREALPQDGPLTSDTSKSLTGMFDQQLAQQLAKKGLGISDMLVKQLSGGLSGGKGAAADKGVDKPGAPDPSSTMNKAGAAGKLPAGASAAPGGAGALRGAGVLRDAAAPGNAGVTSKPAAFDLSRVIRGTAVRTFVPKAGAADSVAAPKVSTAAPAAARAGQQGASKSVGETVQAFVERLRPYAEAAAQTLGVPAHYLLAQAGLETGWGKSQPRTAAGDTSNNLFGVKATGGWKGASVKAETTEYSANEASRTTAQFRSYGSYADSFQDFAKLLQGSRRYASALANSHDAGKYAASLQQAGYATDPHYADKLKRAIETVARYSPASATGVPTQVVAAPADKSFDQG